MRILTLSLIILGSAFAENPATPNILWIVSDDHSWNQLGCTGHPDLKTPRLDDLAAEGMTFTRVYTTSPQCLPSRSSFLSGRDPVATRMTRFTTPIPREVRLLPEDLREAGYYTGVCGRSHHLDGWSYTETIPPLFKKYNLLTTAERFDFAQESNRGTAESRRVVFFEQLEEFFEVRDKEKPFFLQFNLLDPHRAFSSAEINPFAKQYDPSTLTLPADFPDTPAVREDYALFLGMISRMDHDCGRALDLLEKEGLTKNTVVIFIGDNGAAVFRGKGTLYERGLRVPMIVRWPEVVAPGTQCDLLLSGEDLAPTSLAIAGLEIPEIMTGKSFLPLLKGATEPTRQTAFAARAAHGDPLPTNAACFDLSRCIITPTHKLIYNATWQLPFWPVDFYAKPFWLELVEMNKAGTLEKEWRELYFAPQRPMFELYDISTDPLELNNLIDDKNSQEFVSDLRLRLTEWMLLNSDYLPLPAPDAPAER